ncbi:MAG: glycerophosphodiester phosphodiesterase family protein [Bryobacterales bacterium]
MPVIASSKAADAVEVDVYLTSDGKVIVIHDSNTKRVAGVDKLVVDKPGADYTASTPASAKAGRAVEGNQDSAARRGAPGRSARQALPGRRDQVARDFAWFELAGSTARWCGQVILISFNPPRVHPRREEAQRTTAPPTGSTVSAATSGPAR